MKPLRSGLVGVIMRSKFMLERDCFFWRVLLCVLALALFGLGVLEYNGGRSSDERHLVIDVEATAGGVASIYQDVGDGFAEASVVTSSYKGGERESLRFKLLGDCCRALRFDPVLNGAQRISIFSAKVVDSVGTTTLLLPLSAFVAVNDVSEVGGGDRSVVFASDAAAIDPIISINGFKAGVVLDGRGIDGVRFFVRFLAVVALYIFVVACLLCARRFDSDLLGCFVLFLIGFLVFLLRNPDPVFTNVLYAEDGIWSGMLLGGGGVSSFLDARPDYFVLINLLLLKISLWVSFLMGGQDISMLPRVVALVSFSFFSLCAVFIWRGLKDWLTPAGRVFCWLAFIFLYMGGGANEVLGRIANISLVLPAVHGALIAWRIREDRPSVSFLIDVMQLLLALSNPVCVVMGGACFAYAAVGKGEFASKIFYERKKAWMFLGAVAAILLCLMYRYSVAGDFSTLSGESFNWRSVFELLVARSMLFAWISPFYSSFNNFVLLISCMFFVGLAVCAFWVKTENSVLRGFGISLLVFLLSYSVAVVVLRPGLTSWIGGYVGIYPERYFITQNFLAIVFVVWCLERINCAGVMLSWRFLVKALFVIPVVVTWPLVFEFAEPKMRFAERGRDFGVDVRNAFLGREAMDYYDVPTMPKGFAIRVPARYMAATSKDSH